MYMTWTFTLKANVMENFKSNTNFFVTLPRINLQHSIIYSNTLTNLVHVRQPGSDPQSFPTGQNLPTPSFKKCEL